MPLTPTYLERLEAAPLPSPDRLMIVGNPWANPVDDPIRRLFDLVEGWRLTPIQPFFPETLRDEMAWIGGRGLVGIDLSMSHSVKPWRPFYGLAFDPLGSRCGLSIGHTALSFIHLDADPEEPAKAAEEPPTKVVCNGFTAKLALEGALTPAVFRPGRLSLPLVRSRYERILREVPAGSVVLRA
jgi:hypothetical protein